MKVTIEINCDNDPFEQNLAEELRYALAAVPLKVLKQKYRSPCICDAPESIDKVLDSYGNTVGQIIVDMEE